MKKEERPKKVYKIINNHPEYNSEEEREEAFKQIALELALEAQRLREMYPDQKF